MVIRRKALLSTIIGLLTVCLLVTSSVSPVFADVYGTGDYGECTYEGCAPPPPTTVTTPTGLQVSINLTNNQVIPLKGYTITMTPLNGTGSSFQQAAIYVNSVLLQTVTPASDGTASWLWVPQSVGNADVKIIITDTNGDTTTQEFNVQVANQQTTSMPTPSTTKSSGGPAPTTKKTGLSGIVQHFSKSVSVTTAAVLNNATRIVKALPAPIAHSFPYLLFILLGVDIVLVLIQARKELSEYNALQTLVERARILNGSKKIFAQLLSHYLRTPLTILAGGIELLAVDKTLPSDLIEKIGALKDRMKNDIELVINQSQVSITDGTNAASDIAHIGTGNNSVWRQRGLFLPVILIAAIWLTFEYLVGRAGTFSIDAVERTTQALVFTALVLGLYFMLRKRQLARRDALELQYVSDEESKIGHVRDETITTAVATLDNDMNNLQALTNQLDDTPAIKNIKNAQKQFHDVVTKFAIATRLQGSQSESPYSAFDLQEIISSELGAVQPEIAKKALIIERPTLHVVYAQEPELLAFVITSILDNAVAYSRDNGKIQIEATATATSITISITDHGEGISNDKQLFLFQPFSKAEGAEVFTHEGMGFSLYLDKLIMEYLGGSIVLTSQQGEGTTVNLNLPQQLPARAPIPTLQALRAIQ